MRMIEAGHGCFQGDDRLSQQAGECGRHINCVKNHKLQKLGYERLRNSNYVFYQSEMITKLERPSFRFEQHSRSDIQCVNYRNRRPYHYSVSSNIEISKI